MNLNIPLHVRKAIIQALALTDTEDRVGCYFSLSHEDCDPVPVTSMDYRAFIEAIDASIIREVSVADMRSARAYLEAVATVDLSSIHEALQRSYKLVSQLTFDQVIGSYDLCTYAGINPWVVNEGRANSSEKIGGRLFIEDAIEACTPLTDVRVTISL